ncbi:MAG: hypothetical protein GY903_22415 [Fuerstiella sp.]|nr:hypothetical protein [Fuerstiella sp.]MCP4857247.1 hypothetical protein [Fuerstiella sp.]
MLRLLKKLRQDENGVILSGEIVVKGSTMVLGLITGMACLQGAEKEELTSAPAAVGKLDQADAQPETSQDASNNDRKTTGQRTNSAAVCPNCARTKPRQGKPLLAQTGCGHPECTACHHANCLIGRPTDHCSHCYNHGLIGGRAPLLRGYAGGHCQGFGCYGDSRGCGNGVGGYLSGGCVAGTRVIGSPVVERATGVPFMRVSEWPSTRTGLTLTEEQHLLIGTGGTAVGQPFRKPAYINIPDHVW